MVFGKVKKDKLREKVENVGKSTRPYYIKKKYEVYKVKEGDNFIRILPPIGDEDDFGLDIWVHNYIGVDKGSYLCRAKVLGKTCPLCDLHKEMIMGGRDEEAGVLAPKRRTLYWILDTSDKPQSKNPLIFDAPYRQVAEEILRRCVDRKTNEIIDISDLKTGREIMFTLVPKGNKKFSEYKAVDLGDVYPVSESIGKGLVPLREVLEIPTKDELIEVADLVREFGLQTVEENLDVNSDVKEKIKKRIF